MTSLKQNFNGFVVLLLSLFAIMNNTLSSDSANNLIPNFFYDKEFRYSANDANLEIFEVDEFTRLKKLYWGSRNEKVAKVYQQQISQLKTPVAALVKITENDRIKGRKKIYNNELWLYIFDRKKSDEMLVLIDDGIDGFIYDGGDKNLDRVGIHDLDGFRLIDYERKEIHQKINFSFNWEKASISLQEYKQYFKKTLIRLQAQSNPFHPFKGDELLDELKPVNLNEPKNSENYHLKFHYRPNRALGYLSLD